MQMTATTVEIFDPPLCCSTGLCGPTINTDLLNVNEMVLKLRQMGARVERYQMYSHTQAFMSNAQVFELVRERDLAALPITAVNGRVIKVGAYPSVDEVRAACDEAGSEA